MQPDHILIGKQCALCVFGHKIVAHGEVAMVDHTQLAHGSLIGSGNYKIALTEILEDAPLWKCDGFHQTLAEVGVGEYVVWPQNFVDIM